MGKIAEKSRIAKAAPPPFSAFLGLLVDPGCDASLKVLLQKYSGPDLQSKLLRVLQEVKFSHELRRTLGRRVSRARAWFKKRDRWRTRVSKLDSELEALLVEFRDTIYPLLRATNSLPDGYSRESAQTFEAIIHLQKSIESNSILSRTFTTRGHQSQPYRKVAATALRRLKIAGADVDEFLSLIGVKPVL
jgi:hypothetical protein